MNGTHEPEYNISSAGSEGPYVLVLDDFAELKKKRNRLAQRKHRSSTCYDPDHTNVTNLSEPDQQLTLICSRIKKQQRWAKQHQHEYAEK